MPRPRLLVIRGGAIGDFVLTLPAIGLLRDNFPEAHLEILGYQHIIALADRRHYAEATRSIEYAGMSGFFNPRAELDAGLVEYFASFGQIISYLYDPDGFFEGNLRRAGCRHILPAFRRPDDSAHFSRQLAQPLEQLALFLENEEARLFPRADDHAAADALLDREPPGRFIAMHPGSGSPRKNWPLEHWSALGRGLLESGERLLLIGGESDAARIAQLRQAWSGVDVPVIANAPLPHLAGVLQKRCRFFLGHDSGISHVAAAVQVPSLLLFGPTDPEIWAPAGRHVRVLASRSGSLDDLPLAAVGEALRDQPV